MFFILLLCLTISYYCFNKMLKACGKIKDSVWKTCKNLAEKNSKVLHKFTVDNFQFSKL